MIKHFRKCVNDIDSFLIFDYNECTIDELRDAILDMINELNDKLGKGDRE